MSDISTRRKTLLDERAAIVKEADGIVAKAERTEADNTRFTAIETRMTAINADLSQIEKVREMQRTAAPNQADDSPGNIHSIHDRPLKPFASFAEQLLAIRTAALNPSYADPRLYQAALGAGEAVDSVG